MIGQKELKTTTKQQKELLIKEISLKLVSAGVINTDYVIVTKTEKQDTKLTLYHNIGTPFPKMFGLITDKEAMAQMSLNNENWTPVLSIMHGSKSGLETHEHTDREYALKLFAICNEVFLANHIRVFDQGIRRIVKTEVRKEE